jgi:SAM-dependent methyltransferase
MPEVLSSCNLCFSQNIKVVDEECNICRCNTCGYVFDNPRPTPAEIAAYYSNPVKYDAWLEMESERSALWRRRLKKIKRHKKNGTLLDIGTGTGQFLWVARDCFTKCYGTEISASAVDIARERYNLDVTEANLEEIDYKGNVFDNITLFHVLEHVPDPLFAVNKCYQLLATGGVLFVAVPNELFTLKKIVKKILVNTGLRKKTGNGKLGIPLIKLDETSDEIHLSHFTPKVLKDLLHRNGFDILEEGLDPYYVSKGMSLFKENVYYFFLSQVMKLCGVNLYETIWIVARKSSGNGRV